MDYQEALWLRAQLERFPVEAISPLLNIGSSTLDFRTRRQPWITTELLEPLEARGVEILHSDIRAAEGVDIVADITLDADFARLKALQPRALICANVLEHVPDPRVFAHRLEALLEPGGIALLSGPHSYPCHRDPIDNMFRPAPEEAAAMFAHCRMRGGAIVDSGISYRDHIKRRPDHLLIRHILRAPFPFVHYPSWRRSMRKLYWLFNNYLYYGVVLEKLA